MKFNFVGTFRVYSLIYIFFVCGTEDKCDVSGVSCRIYVAWVSSSIQALVSMSAHMHGLANKFGFYSQQT